MRIFEVNLTQIASSSVSFSSLLSQSPSPASAHPSVSHLGGRSVPACPSPPPPAPAPNSSSAHNGPAAAGTPCATTSHCACPHSGSTCRLCYSIAGWVGWIWHGFPAPIHNSKTSTFYQFNVVIAPPTFGGVASRWGLAAKQSPRLCAHYESFSRTGQSVSCGK
jgi:hypothetical protein